MSTGWNKKVWKLAMSRLHICGTNSFVFEHCTSINGKSMMLSWKSLRRTPQYLTSLGCPPHPLPPGWILYWSCRIFDYGTHFRCFSLKILHWNLFLSFEGCMLYSKPKENYSFSNETTSLFMQKAQISVRRKNNGENFNARVWCTLWKRTQLRAYQLS